MASDKSNRQNSDSVSNLTHTLAFFSINDQSQASSAYNASETLTQPKSRDLEEAKKHSDWKFWEEAEQTEVSQLKDNGTFKGPMTLPPGQKHFHCTLSNPVVSHMIAGLGVLHIKFCNICQLLQLLVLNTQETARSLLLVVTSQHQLLSQNSIYTHLAMF
jgi:hypothetical protein